MRKILIVLALAMISVLVAQSQSFGQKTRQSRAQSPKTSIPATEQAAEINARSQSGRPFTREEKARLVAKLFANPRIAERLKTQRSRVLTVSGMTGHDYLPFCEELSSVSGLRSSSQGYTLSDNARQKFTQKERDNETGLDYFGARYYGSPQGRFTSPDPQLASAKRINPQTWNRYSYGNNNPLRFTDPDGQDSEDESGDVYIRNKTKNTEITVQERGGGKIVQQARVTVTESQTDASKK